MINSTSPKNYAKALAEIAKDNVMSYEDIKHNLDTVILILQSSSELQMTLENTAISNSAKIDIINEVFKNQINDKIINFLKILVNKSKFNELPLIIDEFNKILDNVNNIKRVEVVSAVQLTEDLTEDQKNKITEKLKNKLNKNIIAEWIEQPEIIGGLIIKIEDDVIDSSLKKKLENLEITL